MTVRTQADVDPRFQRLRATGDRAIRNELVEEHRWLASYCARRFANRGETEEDLVQVAFVGLVNAVNRYDPARGVAFSTFAMPTIVGELRRHFRDKTWSVHVPRRGKERYQAVVGVVEELTSAFGRSPTVDEIAHRADLTVDETLEALEVGACYRGVPLEPSAVDAPDESVLGIEDEGFAAAEARSVVSSLLRTLPQRRDRRVVELRFIGGLTQSEIAAQVGLSQVQVSRLLHANLARMRQAAGRMTSPS
ncbi:MAG: SigB/SigF/SigG family RNA polymerase sigma factor [Acidimicrobiales bacterium]